MEIERAIEVLTEAEEFLDDKGCPEFKEALRLAVRGLNALLQRIDESDFI